MFWILTFQETEPGTIVLGKSGPFSEDEIEDAIVIALADGCDGVYQMDRAPDMRQASYFVSQGKALAKLPGTLALYINHPTEEVERSVAQA